MSVVNDKYRGTTKYFHVLAELVRAAQYRGLTTYQDIAILMGLPQSGNHMGRDCLTAWSGRAGTQTGAGATGGKLLDMRSDSSFTWLLGPPPSDERREGDASRTDDATGGAVRDVALVGGYRGASGRGLSPPCAESSGATAPVRPVLTLLRGRGQAAYGRIKPCIRIWKQANCSCVANAALKKAYGALDGQ